MKQNLRDYSDCSLHDSDAIQQEYQAKAPGTLLGLRKVKRFFNLNKKDGALSSS